MRMTLMISVLDAAGGRAILYELSVTTMCLNMYVFACVVCGVCVCVWAGGVW